MPDNSIVDALPQMRFLSSTGDIGTDTGAPEIFTERLMQLQLGRFWRNAGLRRNGKYDPTQGEERYERFYTEYIHTLPSTFSLEPDTRWDTHTTKLAMQRQLLHISIFDSVCWNYRPLLMLKPTDIAAMAPYKQVLLQSQREKLALAALKELEAISNLHSMLGGAHTRFGGIIFNTFEAAVLLLCLRANGDLPFEHTSTIDLLGLRANRPTRQSVLQGAEMALRRLEMLAQISEMAALGARVVTKLFAKATRSNSSSDSGTPVSVRTNSSWPSSFSTLTSFEENTFGQWASSEQSSQTWVAELLSSTSHDERISESSSLAFNVQQNGGGDLDFTQFELV